MSPIGVQIVDDHPAIREMMAHVLDEKMYALLSVAGSVQQAIEESQQHQIDFVMLDLIFPDSTGEQLVHHYARQLATPRMLIYSSTRDMYLPAQCIKAGAHGFLDKGAPLSELTAAIDTVATKKAPFIPQKLQEYLDWDADETHQLTPREKEVARFITLGLSSKMIASKLSISDGTVNIHRTNLMRKLNAHSMAEVIRHALNTGLVSSEEIHIKK